jgi:hypothetical protein
MTRAKRQRFVEQCWTIDVSDFIQENHTELIKSLDILATHIEKGENRQHQYNLVLAKAVSETGRLVTSMAARLGVIEKQPSRAPKAKLGNTQPMEKGFGGGDGAAKNDNLSKSDIMDGLDGMMEKSIEAGQGGVTSDGFDLNIAASKFEQFGQINPVLLGHVEKHVRNGAAQ